MPNDPSPRRVCDTIRRLKRLQCADSSMGKDVLDYITAHKLVIQTEWPAYVIRISEAGAEYLAEHDAN